MAEARKVTTMRIIGSDDKMGVNSKCSCLTISSITATENSLAYLFVLRLPLIEASIST